MGKRQFRVPPAFWSRPEEGLRKIVNSILALLAGKTNNTFDVTLVAGATSTTLASDIITEDTIAHLTPKSASAAAAIAQVWTSTSAKLLTINHDSSSATDRIFGVSLVG